MRISLSRAAAALALLSSFGAGTARAQSSSCQRFIRTLPYTINSSLHYCLARNLSTGTDGIHINADRVVLDLNGFEIASTAPATDITNGIFADSREDVTIRNGTLRGFYGAILLASAATPGRARDYVVEDVRVRDSGFFGINVDGFDSVVHGCTVTDTGGSPLVGTTGGNAFGIILSKGASQALDNSVLEFFPSGAGTAAGIWVTGGNFALIGNRVSGGTTGPHVGLRMNSTQAGYRDNVVWRVDTPYVGGIDLGNNSAY